MIGKFPKVQKFYNLNPKKDSGQYILDELSNTIILRFYRVLEKLETQPQTILCTRGDSKENTDEHDKFFQNDLDKFFIVGDKSDYHFSNNVKNIYRNTYNKNKKLLQKELKELILEANNAMNKRDNEFSMKVLEYFTELQLDKFDIDSLLKQKVFFLSFFHTDGRLGEFSAASPFLSVTYGSKKYTIARKFALGLGKDNPKDKAYIYLYSLNAGDPYYLKTNILSRELRKKGAKWHYDKYQEILLINGMFPHYILGIFEVEKNITPRFFINPSLHKVLEREGQFDYVNGLKIDQENFYEYAKELGYKNYFFTEDNNTIQTNKIGDKSEPEKVIKP